MNLEFLSGFWSSRTGSGSASRLPQIMRMIALGFNVVACWCAVAILPVAQTDELPKGSISNQGLGPTPGLSHEDILAGWLSLFDGESLFGWKAVTDANWQVAAGEIRVDSGTRGLLRTTTQFDDFELSLEFKCSEQTNSGIFLRTSPEPADPLTDCYELNIASRRIHPFPTGSLVNRVATKKDFSADTWHQVRVLADGARFQVWINEKQTLDYLDPKPLGRGYLGLQYQFRGRRVSQNSPATAEHVGDRNCRRPGELES